MLRRLSSGALAAALLIGAACGDDDDDITPPPPPPQNDFTATLAGSSVLPSPVTTTASGEALITINEAAGTITFTVNVTELVDPTDVTLHIGAATDVSPSVADLMPQAAVTGTVNGQLSTGSIAAADLVGGATFDALVTAIRGGNAYVSVLTTANPAGELRGQLLPRT